MKVLHILKSEPDEWVEWFIDSMSGDEGAIVVPLYQSRIFPEDKEANPVNWDQLVEDIFSSSKVICWW